MPLCIIHYIHTNSCCISMLDDALQNRYTSMHSVPRFLHRTLEGPKVAAREVVAGGWGDK